jgi:hypothetical protein
MDSSVTRRPWHVSLCLVLLLALVASTSQAQRPARGPQPLDPLTPREKQQAEQIARDDARVKELLGAGRTRLVYVDFMAVKPTQASAQPDSPTVPLAIGRRAEVVFYRYDGDYGIRAVVNLQQGRIEDVRRMESAEVPLTVEDLTDALALARRHDEVKQLLGDDSQRFQVENPARPGPTPRNVVRALRVVAVDASDPCWQHRCVQLFFRRGAAFLIDSAFVDLTTGQVRVERGQR